MPGAPRFPQRDKEWLAERTKEKELLVEWLENFKSVAGEYEQAQKTINEVEDTIDLFNSIVSKIKGPLLIQNARNARTKDGSVLEYGLEYHLNHFTSQVFLFFSYHSLPLSILAYIHAFHYIYSLRKDFQGTLDSQREIMNGLNLSLNREICLLTG